MEPWSLISGTLFLPRGADPARKARGTSGGGRHGSRGCACSPVAVATQRAQMVRAGLERRGRSSEGAVVFADIHHREQRDPALSAAPSQARALLGIAVSILDGQDIV